MVTQNVKIRKIEIQIRWAPGAEIVLNSHCVFKDHFRRNRVIMGPLTNNIIDYD